MAIIERFEDVKAWQSARELCKIIHHFTLRTSFSKDYQLVGQIKGSSGSIIDNIAEGFERNGNNEFLQFLSISKGSCGETRSQLYRALDNEYIKQDEFDQILHKTEDLSKMISGLMDYLNKCDIKGSRYKH
ncbi:MAG: four helix bundle protein [Methylococcaceae bacterium]|nr:four helix bundle protein [Prolixibacteraceae bacterium]